MPGIFLDLWTGGGTCHCRDREALSLWPCSPPAVPAAALTVGCLGMRPGLGVQLLVCQAGGCCRSSPGTSRSPWLAFQGYAGGAAGRSLGPQLPSASCLRFCSSFSVSVLAACQPCIPVWELDIANSQDLGFPSSTWTLDLLSEPTGPCRATVTFSYYFLEVAQVM